jgi:hypothetical protein
VTLECSEKSAMKECPICVDILEEGVDLCATPCKHEFHKACLISYANFNRDKDTLLCPVCRNVILERTPPMLEDRHATTLRYFSAIYGDEFARYMLNACVSALLLLGLLILLITIVFAFGRNRDPLP